MKKFLSIVLAAAMVMAMSVTAFAGTQQFIALPGSQNIDVYVRLDTDGDGTPDLEDDTPYGESICVDLVWPDVVEFIYSTEWDPVLGEFVNLGWQDSDLNITITNRSTVGVTAVLAYNDNDAGYNLVFDEMTMNHATFDATTKTVVLENPLDVTLEEVAGVKVMPYAIIKVIPDVDAATPSVDSDDAVGTITVTISRTAEPAPEPEPVTVSWTDDGTDVQPVVASVGADVRIEFFAQFNTDPNVPDYYVESVACDTEGVVSRVNDYTIRFAQTGEYTVTLTMHTVDTRVFALTKTINVTITE